MERFVDLPAIWKTSILSMYLLLFLFQAALLTLCIYLRNYRGIFWRLLLPGVVFVIMMILGISVYYPRKGMAELHTEWILLLWALFLAEAGVSAGRLYRLSQKTLTGRSIKQAVDSLPSGLCYFDEQGVLVLCNSCMQKLFHLMHGTDLQMLHELEAVLESNYNGKYQQEEKVYHFVDGAVYSFRRREFDVEDCKHYIQYTAVDMTELYQLRENITERNEELQRMITRVRRITENVADITKQQEILTAKMRVHNKMGNCLLTLRRYMAGDSSASEEAKQMLIRTWRENLDNLQEEISPEAEPDAFQMVVDIAENIGLHIEKEGEFPEDTGVRVLLVAALRECVTNAVKHARATSLSITIRSTAKEVTASFKNNGRKPSMEIAEGGGLTSLRQKIESAGGTMSVTSLPEFILTVSMRIEGSGRSSYDKSFDRR